MRRSQLLWVLVGVNALLVVALAWKLGGDNPAHAAAAGRGDYIMMPARVGNFNNGVVFVLDTRDGVLSAFAYDNNRKELNVMDPVNVQRLFQGGAGVGRNVPRP